MQAIPLVGGSGKASHARQFDRRQVISYHAAKGNIMQLSSDVALLQVWLSLLPSCMLNVHLASPGANVQLPAASRQKVTVTFDCNCDK